MARSWKPTTTCTTSSCSCWPIFPLVGWLFLLGLAAYLLAAAWRTLGGKSAEAQAEGPWRAVLLCSLLALLIVSNVGFPWRMAATGALFALCLAGLAASDARLGFAGPAAAARLAWRPRVFPRTGGLRHRCHRAGHLRLPSRRPSASTRSCGQPRSP